MKGILLMIAKFRTHQEKIEPILIKIAGFFYVIGMCTLAYYMHLGLI